MLPRLMNWLANKDGNAGVPQRLLHDYGRQHVSAYVVAAVLGAITSGCIGTTAYLVKAVVNEVWANRNFWAVVAVSIAVMVLFTAKGLSMYFSSIILARASNRMAAELQRQAFDKL